MNNFDLREIHELIPFRDLFASDHEYMTELSHFPRIELETEPLYIILIPQMSILFTQKLRYYQACIECEVNKHINAAIALLEANGTEELTKFILKKTREAIITLINESNSRLAFCDGAWSNITSHTPIISDSARPETENAVFIHYTIAELVRCWLELQDRYAYVIGEAACYDASLFYTSIVKRMPDDEFELKRFGKYKEEPNNKQKNQTTKKKVINKPQPTKPMTLRYYCHGNNGILTKQRCRVNILYKKWTEWNFIDKDTNPDDFDAFFEGEPRHCNITWTANTTVLTILLQELLKRNYIADQTGCSASSLAKKQFCKNPNFERNRLDKTAENRITLSLLILDMDIPLPEGNSRNMNDENINISDAALNEIWSGQLRKTKGI